MGARHASRMLALQALYALEMNPEASPDEVIESARSEAAEGLVDAEFLAALVAGAWTRRATLDRTIEQASKHWKLSRMDRIDKSILRLALYELLHTPETAAPVILDEGVELAKEFGTPDSASFINGVLDHIAREARPGELAGRIS
ncbi:MAG: transcription antitermination factor NusB [Deltaproteobacteria bacterium]|nr:transcription antitermination factor NusB [Deltaproteobacteria bacterium]